MRANNMSQDDNIEEVVDELELDDDD